MPNETKEFIDAAKQLLESKRRLSETQHFLREMMAANMEKLLKAKLITVNINWRQIHRS